MKFTTLNLRRYLMLLPIVFILILLGLTIYSLNTTGLSTRQNKAATQWSWQYWRSPIPMQGTAPPKYHPQAQGLRAEDCGGCHADKLLEWSQSRHSQAMGMAMQAQYFSFNSLQQADCNPCHAPMTEQALEIELEDGGMQPNPHFQNDLQHQGVTCAACHLRGHQHYGPPLLLGQMSQSATIHGEPLRSPYFEASEFCRPCHQYEKMNNIFNPIHNILPFDKSVKEIAKPLQNTFQEWLKSPAFSAGKTCQNCHMPERQHRFQGIHDKEMTLSGVTITHEVKGQDLKVGQAFTAKLNLANTATGHYFPTYTTPAIFLKAAFFDDQGQLLAPKNGIEYTQEIVIQRRINTSQEPSREEFDTRLAPGEAAELIFSRTVPPQAKLLKLWVWVEPEHFYTGFFREQLGITQNHPSGDLLKNTSSRTLSLAEQNHYEVALTKSQASPYELYSVTYNVN